MSKLNRMYNGDLDVPVITKAEVIRVVIGVVIGFALLGWAFNRALNISGY